jgi:DNA-3-methyladenine glycosylase
VKPEDRRFFQRDPLTCARELIGCELVWNECAGIIVETEAYYALGDEACHTFRAAKRARLSSPITNRGAAYVYFNYGMYWLLNVLVKGGRHDGFVLFRAIEATRGIECMTERRRAHRNSRIAHPQALCSGPGKLTIALGVDGRDHGRDLCAGGAVGFRPRSTRIQVQADVRVGISKAAHLPWRFLLRGSPFVSVAAGAKIKGRGRDSSRRTRALS